MNDYAKLVNDHHDPVNDHHYPVNDKRKITRGRLCGADGECGPSIQRVVGLIPTPGINVCDVCI